MEKKVCCFGELLFRISPDNNFLQNNIMPFYAGGAELNAATALANWNIPVQYITALPNNYLSKNVVQYIEQKGIDSSSIIFTGDRIGIYYLPFGSELKNEGVIYDRSNSSFAGLMPGEIDWDTLLVNCSWFHFSAISAALNLNVAAVCKEAVEAAARKGIPISIDLNYRAKLWQYGVDPVSIMPDLLKHCTVIMGNIWAVKSLLGIPSKIENSNNKTEEQLIDAAEDCMLQLQKQYPKAITLAFTYRLQNCYFTILQHLNKQFVSKKYDISIVVDKVGSGDCFMAGLIYGLYKGKSAGDIIEFATAAAVLKLAEAGDATKQTIENINKKIISE